MTKQSWFKLHSWLGIKLAIFLCFILVTGTLAVVSHEIDWLTNPAKRVSPLPATDEINWLGIYQQAQTQSPRDPISSLSAPIDPWFAAEVIKVDKNNQRYRQFFHPVTAEYQGDGRWYNWQRFFRMTHRHLMMPTQIGITLVCVMALFLIASMISGTVIYPKWWRGFFRWPRRNNSRVFWNDIHRLSGLWSLWLLIVISVTGVWYLVEIWGARAVYPPTGKPVTAEAKQRAVQPTPAIFQRALDTAKAVHPDLSIREIRLPVRKRQPITVQGQDPTVLVRDRATNVVIDPISGQLLSSRLAQNLSAHARISEAADPLHFGTFAGLYSKLIYFVFGLILCALAITGIYLYGLHYTRSTPRAPATQKAIWAAAWGGMRRWKWLSLLLLLVCTVLTILVFFTRLAP